MKIHYIREMKRNYMMVEADSEADFQARMLADNPVQGLLKINIKYKDGQELYYYDITSRQPLRRFLESHSIARSEITCILTQLGSVLDELEHYFLEDGGILLEPDYIYIEPELFKLSFCFVPGENGNFSENLSRLLQYLLKYINHRDRECVMLAYALYQESLKENFSIEDLFPLTLIQGEERWEEKNRERQKEEKKEEKDALSEVVQTEEKEILDSKKPAFLTAILSGIYKILFRGKENRQGKKVKQTNAEMEENSWQILYDEEELEEGKEEEPLIPISQPEDFQTVLLNDKELESDSFCLIGTGPETGNIIIPYVPFIIGKHQELADYILEKDTVSRFHVRLDCVSGQYTITDLNSTNGTRVRGKLLNANETAVLEEGDEIVIADISYRWGRRERGEGDT